jgi:hypothetical protein
VGIRGQAAGVLIGVAVGLLAVSNAFVPQATETVVLRDDAKTVPAAPPPGKGAVTGPRAGIEYSIIIASPDPSIDYKILWAKPDPRIDYKIMIYRGPEAKTPTCSEQPAVTIRQWFEQRPETRKKQGE